MNDHHCESSFPGKFVETYVTKHHNENQWNRVEFQAAYSKIEQVNLTMGLSTHVSVYNKMEFILLL